MSTLNVNGYHVIFPQCPVWHAAPWLLKLANAVIQGKLEQRQDQLAAEAVTNLEKLGPTFIKLGQILSIRHGCYTETDVCCMTPKADTAFRTDVITESELAVMFYMLHRPAPQ